MTGGLDAILVIFGALAGAVVGSFAGVVRARGWRGAVRGRSRCEGCRRELRWYELVPVVSYACLLYTSLQQAGCDIAASGRTTLTEVMRTVYII